MKAGEFEQFTKRLFVAFPSLREWLLRNSPDPNETCALWERTLSGYSLADCDSVLNRWTSGELKPFEAYERDKVHLCIKAVIDRDRDKVYRRQERLREVDQRQQRRSAGQGDPVRLVPTMDSEMTACMRELQPHFRRVLEGEMTQEEYDAMKDVVIAKHLTPPKQEWVA